MKKFNLKFKIIFLAIFCFAFFGWAGHSLALPAFPGAAGMGASATGARGYGGSKSVCIVSNTNDAGAGSFRDCVAGKGKEGTYVVFSTSGTINLQSPVLIKSSYLTIAGQTSPGGIAIAGDEVAIGDGSDYNYHDIIISHMRFREGSHNCAPNCDITHSFSVWKSHDIVIDHCSFSWGVDETVAVTTYTDASAYNIVFSWCIFSEGLADPAPETNHGYGLLFNGKWHNDPPNSISLHHNFFTSHNGRMPELHRVFADVRNNVVYNWDASSNTVIFLEDGLTSRINFIENYSKPGPESNACDPISNSFELMSHGAGTQACIDTTAIAPYPMLYASGNLGCTRDEASDSEWVIGCGWSGNKLSEAWRQADEWPTNDIAVPTNAMTANYAIEILETVGATRPVRDSHDTAMVAQYMSGTGAIKRDTTWPDDWPVFSVSDFPADVDKDGMSDSWELFKFGNLDKNGHTDTDEDGYADLEEYLHELGGYAIASIPADIVMPAAPSGLSVQ